MPEETTLKRRVGFGVKHADIGEKCSSIKPEQCALSTRLPNLFKGGITLRNVPTLLFALAALVTSSYALSVIEGPITRPETGNSYYLLDNDTWPAAEQFAEDSLGGSLVLIDDSLENQWVYDTFSPLIPPYSTPRHSWIGLHHDDTADTWVGPQGEEITYVNWLDNIMVWCPFTNPDYDYVLMLMCEPAPWYDPTYWVNTDLYTSGVFLYC